MIFRLPISYTVNREKWSLFGFLCSLVIFLSSPFSSSLRTPFEQLYLSVLPLQATLSTWIAQPRQWIRYHQSGVERIADLEVRNAQLRVSIAESEFLRKENMELKSLLGKTGELKNVGIQSVTTARIVNHQGFSHMIDQGENQGVKVDDLILSNGALIGTVKRVEKEFSEVELLENGTVQVLATTLSGITGIVTAHRQQVWFTELPADAHIEIGENIYTAGNPSSTIPAGLVIGQVQSVEHDLSMPSPTVRIDLIGSSDSFQIVVVGRKG